MCPATDTAASPCSDALNPELVHAAADRLVATFAATDTVSYFACFSEDASFIFHPEDTRLDDRGSYERLWDAWLASGWRVASCSSTNRRVQVYGDTAVLSHDVVTTTSTDGVASTTYERESIVFRLVDGAVLAVHEHLSPGPAPTRSPDEDANC